MGFETIEYSVEAAIAIYRSLHSEHPRRKDILYRLAGALSTGGRFEEVVLGHEECGLVPTPRMTDQTHILLVFQLTKQLLQY